MAIELHVVSHVQNERCLSNEGCVDQTGPNGVDALHFYYFSGATPSAVRYKNWKMYTMSQPGATGWILPLVPFHFTLVQNIKRDPFEQVVGIDQKTALGLSGALGGPATGFLYDWNIPSASSCG